MLQLIELSQTKKKKSKINFDLHGGLTLEEQIEHCTSQSKMRLFSCLSTVRVSANIQFSSMGSKKPQHKLLYQT